jgi:undecaprenyl-diphosphatase
LRLTAGVLVLIAACGIFGDITEDVVTGDSTVEIDFTVANFFHERATPTTAAAMKAFSFLGSVAFLTAATALFAIYFGWRRKWHRLVLLLSVVPGGMLLNVMVKHVVRRHRPIFENPILTLGSYSFPSGHTMGATLFYGLVATLAVLASRRWPPKVFAVLSAILIIGLVGFSRIYLGAHYLSDVLGAITASVAWLTLCFSAGNALRRP